MGLNPLQRTCLVRATKTVYFMPLGNEARDKFLDEKNGTFHIFRGELGLLFPFYQWKLHNALVCSLFDTQILSDYVTSKFSVCGCCGFHHRSYLQRECSLTTGSFKEIISAIILSTERNLELALDTPRLNSQDKVNLFAPGCPPLICETHSPVQGALPI